MLLRQEQMAKCRYKNSKQLSSEGINATEKEILNKLHSLLLFYSTQRSKQEYSLKSGAVVDDTYKSK